MCSKNIDQAALFQQAFCWIWYHLPVPLGLHAVPSIVCLPTVGINLAWKHRAGIHSTSQLWLIWQKCDHLPMLDLDETCTAGQNNRAQIWCYHQPLFWWQPACARRWRETNGTSLPAALAQRPGGEKQNETLHGGFSLCTDRFCSVPLTFNSYHVLCEQSIFMGHSLCCAAAQGCCSSFRAK